jgi:hypothetical protein
VEWNIRGLHQLADQYNPKKQCCSSHHGNSAFKPKHCRENQIKEYLEFQCPADAIDWMHLAVGRGKGNEEIGLDQGDRVYRWLLNENSDRHGEPVERHDTRDPFRQKDQRRVRLTELPLGRVDHDEARNNEEYIDATSERIQGHRL